MKREQLKQQIEINLDKDEITKKERLINIMQCIDAHIEQLPIKYASNDNRTVCEKHVCVESKVNVGYRVCVNCYALFPIAN